LIFLSHLLVIVHIVDRAIYS